MRLKTATDVGVAIRERRRALGLDQATLARKIGSSRLWVVQIEKGKSRAALMLVLRALDALGLVLRADDGVARPAQPPIPGAEVDLAQVIEAHRRPRNAKR